MFKALFFAGAAFFAQVSLAQDTEVIRLGSSFVENNSERVSVNVPNTCGVTRIAVTVRGERARVNAVIVDYQAERAGRTRIPVNRNLNTGESTGWLNLPGNTRCVDRVIVVGESLASRRPSRVDIYAYRPANSNVGARVLGTVRISEGTSFEYHNLRNVCGIRQVRLRVLNDSAHIDYIAVRFVGTGRFQQIPVRQNFARGSTSAWKDLRGANRCIDSFFVVGRSGSRPRDARIQLIGR